MIIFRKDRIIFFCDKLTECFLYLLIFYLPFSPAGVEICFGFAFLGWIIKKLLDNKNEQLWELLYSTKLSKPLFTFMLANAVSVIMSVIFVLSIRAFFSKFLENLFIFLMAADTINNKKRLRNLIMVIFFSVIIIFLDAGVQYFRGVDFLRGRCMSGQRVSASFINPNDFVAWLNIPMLIVLSLFFSKHSKNTFFKKFIQGSLIIILLTSMIFANSRGGWLGFFAGLIFLVLFKPFGFTKKKKRLKGLLIIALIIIIFVWPLILREHRYKEGIAPFGIGSSSGERLKLWKVAVDIIKDFPFFGSGLNTYMTVSSNYHAPGGERGGGSYPHNIFLHIAAELGLVGLACFIWLLISWYRMVIQVLRKYEAPLLLGLASGITAFFVHGSFDTIFYSLQLSALFWFMLGIGVRLQKIVTTTGS